MTSNAHHYLTTQKLNIFKNYLINISLELFSLNGSYAHQALTLKKNMQIGTAERQKQLFKEIASHFNNIYKNNTSLQDPNLLNLTYR